MTDISKRIVKAVSLPVYTRSRKTHLRNSLFINRLQVLENGASSPKSLLAKRHRWAWCGARTLRRAADISMLLNGGYGYEPQP